MMAELAAGPHATADPEKRALRFTALQSGAPGAVGVLWAPLFGSLLTTLVFGCMFFVVMASVWVPIIDRVWVSFVVDLAAQ
jgi:hypothetical protein